MSTLTLALTGQRVYKMAQPRRADSQFAPSQLIRNLEGQSQDATSRDHSTAVSAPPVYDSPTVCGTAATRTVRRADMPTTGSERVGQAGKPTCSDTSRDTRAGTAGEQPATSVWICTTRDEPVRETQRPHCGSWRHVDERHGDVEHRAGDRASGLPSAKTEGVNAGVCL